MTRNIIVLSVCLFFFLAGCVADDRWKLATEIEQSIALTSFPADTFNIADFGAVADDSAILNTDAIEAAIMTCYSGGGGVVS